MDQRLSPAVRRKSPPGRLYATLASAILLSAAAATASASTCASDECDDAARDAPSFIVAVPGLTVRIVGLGDADDAAEATASDVPGEPMAPLLYLTPRVASILEEVFDDETPAAADPAAPADDALESAVSASGETDRPMSPVAESSAARGHLSTFDDKADLPNFQRQMYRTDI